MCTACCVNPGLVAGSLCPCNWTRFINHIQITGLFWFLMIISWIRCRFFHTSFCVLCFCAIVMNKKVFRNLMLQFWWLFLLWTIRKVLMAYKSKPYNTGVQAINHQQEGIHKGAGKLTSKIFFLKNYIANNNVMRWY